MAIFLTLLGNLVWFAAVELYVLMGWGSNANAVLVGVPILYIVLVIFSIVRKDIIGNHLIIANGAMIVVLILVIAVGSLKFN
jgi:hypothetical protein